MENGKIFNTKGGFVNVSKNKKRNIKIKKSINLYNFFIYFDFFLPNIDVK